MRMIIKQKKKLVFALSILLLLAATFSLAGCGRQEAETAAENSASTVPAAVTSQPLDEQTAAYYTDVAGLQAELDKVVVIDARVDKEFNAGHIPGAVNITWQALSNMEAKQGETGWGVVLPADKLAAKLGSFGIDGSRPVVVYNDPKGLGEEGRVHWMLKIAGLSDVKMLNGGWPAWTAAGGATTTEATAVTPVTMTIASEDLSRFATTQYIQENQATIKLVDARSPEEYAGETNHGEKVKGRIPGAITLPYNEAYNADGTIKSIADLQALFQTKGLNPADDIVVYCTVGIRSGFLTQILHMAGYEKAKNYNASFSEWAGADLPSEK